MTHPQTPSSYPNLGTDGLLLADWFDTMLGAINYLRSGSLRLDGSRDPATMHVLQQSLIDISDHLQPRVEGVIDALLTAHRAAGGTWSELTDRAGLPLGTLRARVKRLEADGSHWATWARGELNPHFVYDAVDLPTRAQQEGVVAALFSAIEEDSAAEAAAEREGKGARLPNNGARLDLGEGGVAFLDNLQPLTPAKGFPAVGQLTLSPEQEVSLFPGGDGWWRLRLHLRGDDESLLFVISQSIAAQLVQAATADPE